MAACPKWARRLCNSNRGEAEVGDIVPGKSGQTGTRKGKIQFLIGAAIIVVLAIAFASITMWALRIRSATSSVFAKYVTSQKIGTAQVTDDASGFQSDFCVLHLNHPVPTDQLQSETMGLFEKYHQLDGGDHLTLEYTTANGKTVIQSDAVLVDNSHVSITLHEPSGVNSKTVLLPPQSAGGAGNS